MTGVYVRFIMRWVVACFGLVYGAYAQDGAEEEAPFAYQVEVGAGASTGAQMPFWLHANRHGMVDRTAWLGYTRLNASPTVWQRGRFRVNLGADLVARVSEHAAVYFNQLYAKARWGAFQLRVGREVETIGTIAGNLSSGSLATSLNATPMPKVVFSTPNYVAVPWTQAWIHVKGYYAHGWFESDRYVRSPWLHQKHAYVRIGGERRLRAYVGLVHDAMWGGTDPGLGPLPDGLNDYWRTITADRGAEDAPGGERIYVQGNHLGIYDAGLEVRLKGYEIQAYRHFLYDDRDGLKLKNMQDGLLGIALRLPEDVAVLQEVVYEHLYTKWQGGPEKVGPGRDGPGGWDDYYNHYIYDNGWTYHRRTIGSPFLFSYDNPGESGSSRLVANTRVVAHHVGVSGSWKDRGEYRVLASYSRSYGTYFEQEAAQRAGSSYRFEEGLEQWSFLAEILTRLRNRLFVGAAIGWDTGETYDKRFGGWLRLVYRGTEKPIEADSTFSGG